MHRRRVLFPEPLGPQTTTVWPRWITSLMRLRTWKWPYHLLISLISIIGLESSFLLYLEAPADDGAKVAGDEENDGHETEELDGPHFQPIHDRGSPNQLRQPDDKGETRILVGHDALGDHARQHAAEGDGYQEIAGCLPVGEAGGIARLDKVPAHRLEPGPEDFAEVGRLEDDKGNRRRREGVHGPPHNDGHDEVEPEDHQDQGNVPDEVDVERDRVVDPLFLGDSAQ